MTRPAATRRRQPLHRLDQPPFRAPPDKVATIHPTAAHEVAEAYVPVEPVLLHAMSWAAELGVPYVSPATGAALRLLATAARARTIVEIGTGTGVSGLWLLRGLTADGVLTSIDVETEHQALARQSFAAAGFAPARYRLIAGTSRDVLPRLADAAYDLVFVDGDVVDYPDGVAAAARLLREDGVLVVPNALVTLDEPGERATVADLVATLRNSPQWTTALLATGTGLLCATRTAQR